jgi:hypothetical protein
MAKNDRIAARRGKGKRGWIAEFFAAKRETPKVKKVPGYQSR